MPLIQERTYTTEDIYALPEGQRAELIDGQIYDMAPSMRQIWFLTLQICYPEKNCPGLKFRAVFFPI